MLKFSKRLKAGSQSEIRLGNATRNVRKEYVNRQHIGQCALDFLISN
jgi:hypothetical protein